MAEVGGVVHTHSTPGTEEVADLAELARTELLVIDDDTTTRRFQCELRWNAANYRLAGSL